MIKKLLKVAVALCAVFMFMGSSLALAAPSLTGEWKASNGNVDIFVIQNGVTVLVNWTQQNPYWNYAAGTVKDSQVKMTFGGTGSQSGTISSDGNKITWESPSNYWTRVN